MPTTFHRKQSQKIKINFLLSKDIKEVITFRNNVTEFTNMMKAGMIKYNKGARGWMYNDGVMDKVLYNFGMLSPFHRTYNLFFVFVEYCLTIDAATKAQMLRIATERFNNMQVNYDMPDDIKAEIAALFAPGTPETSTYLLDREMNKADINMQAAALTREFGEGVALPAHEGHAALYEFYNTFKANF